mgnify:CR=1 FL=1
MDRFTYDAVNLAAQSHQEILALPAGVWKLNFSDGKSITTTKERTVFSHFFWRLHREFPGCGVLSSHHLGNGQYVKGAELELCAKVLWDVWDNYTHHKPNNESTWEMSKVVYEIMNDIHNFTVSDLTPYVTTVDMGAISQLVKHPKIVKAKAELNVENETPVDVKIENIYKVVLEVITSDDPDLVNNGIAQMARAKLLSTMQVVQLLGVRGFVTATDGTMYPEPVLTSYSEGLSTNYDSVTESRSASLALYMNSKPLQDSEYFNRQMQLLTEVISEVTYSDCGSPGMEWLVDSDDLRGLTGKMHMVDGRAVEIKESDVDLVGKIIQLRSITVCKNPNSSSVCSVCLGATAYAVPPRTNIGHALTIEPLSAASQLILGTKHVVSSVASLYLEIEPHTASWLKHDTANRSIIKLKKKNVSNTFILRFAKSEAKGLNTVTHCTDPAGILPQRISCLSELEIATADMAGNQKSDWTRINTTIGGVGSALSTNVIMCIKRNGVEVKDGLVRVVLDNFNGKELFITPRRNEDMMTYLKTLEHFVFGVNNEKGESITNYTNCSQAVAALKRIFDEKLKVGVIHAEVFIKACMVRDLAAGDYRMPVGGEDFQFVKAKQLIYNRSISAALAYQTQRELLTKPLSYIIPDEARTSHPLDSLL